MTENTIINIPIAPEEIGVALPPSQLRRIDFSALDFEAIRRATVEYVRTYYASDFNDFVLSNGFIMFLEIVSAAANILSERSDIIADEAFLPTAQSRDSVAQHLELIGQRIQRATPATVNVECSISVPSQFDVIIPAGLIFTVSGPDGNSVFYELFSAPNDYTGNIIIPKGKRGVIAYGIEGKFATEIQQSSNGEDNQTVIIDAGNVIDDPISVTLTTGDVTTTWERVEFLQLADSNDEVFEVEHLEESTIIKFGDDINGKSPIQGQTIGINYRLGGGVRGKIGTGVIDETRPIAQTGFATQNVIFRNTEPSVGGQDNESLESAKRRAPRQYSAHGNAATSEDYINLSEGFSHPAFGTVLKASSTIRTGIDADIDTVVANVRAADTAEEAKLYLLGNYVNRNIVEIYILQDNGNIPIAPSNGLKESLKTYLSELNVLTDEIRILDGSIRPIDVNSNIIVSRNVDAALVKEQVLFAIEDFFDVNNIEMGTSFSRSKLVTAIQSVPGVSSLTLFEPIDDYPALGTVVDTDPTGGVLPQGIGVNEIYSQGSTNIQFFYEQRNLNI
jgi:hypothetical protein